MNAVSRELGLLQTTVTTQRGIFVTEVLGKYMDEFELCFAPLRVSNADYDT